MADFACPYCGADLKKRGPLVVRAKRGAWWKYAPISVGQPRHFCPACEGQLIPTEARWLTILDTFGYFAAYFCASYLLSHAPDLHLGLKIGALLALLALLQLPASLERSYSKRKAYARTARQFEWPEGGDTSNPAS